MILPPPEPLSLVRHEYFISMLFSSSPFHRPLAGTKEEPMALNHVFVSKKMSWKHRFLRYFIVYVMWCNSFLIPFRTYLPFAKLPYQYEAEAMSSRPGENNCENGLAIYMWKSVSAYGTSCLLCSSF